MSAIYANTSSVTLLVPLVEGVLDMLNGIGMLMV